MEAAEPSRKTRAIMFSDIQGYSKLMGEDESLALRLLEEHNAICVPLIKQSGGAVLKFIGDAILSSFESASDAVQCGLTLQRLLAERNASRPDIVPLVLRIGIHIGDVVFKDGDVFGDGVNIAARIEPLAEPGGIAISQTVYDMIKARPEIQTVSLGSKELKNIKEAVNIYKVLIDANAAPQSRADRATLAKALAVLAVVLAAVAAGMRWRARAPALAPAATSDDAKAARQQRYDARSTAYWQTLRPQLLSNNIADAEKQRLAAQFYGQYRDDPGIELGTARELARYMPPGPDKDALVALASSPQGREAEVRLTLRIEARKRVAATMTFSGDADRRAFFKNCPLGTTGNFIDVKFGEPARDPRGNLIFRYSAKPGDQRDVPVSPDVFKAGPVGEAAIAKAAGDLAADFLRR